MAGGAADLASAAIPPPTADNAAAWATVKRGDVEVAVAPAELNPDKLLPEVIPSVFRGFGIHESKGPDRQRPRVECLGEVGHPYDVAPGGVGRQLGYHFTCD